MSERDEEREHEKGFRVVDRRRFTTDGEVRKDAPPERPAAAAPLPPPPPAPRQEPAQGTRPAKGDGERHDPRRAAPESAEPSGPPSNIDFLSFAASLATNALAAMGALPEAQARGLPKSPELAKEYIDILAMLQQKTRGNLTREEEGALQQMLTELRLHFVESSRPRR
jgi:hypothetical protein